MQPLKHVNHFFGSGDVPTTGGQNELKASITGAAPPTAKFVGGAARSSVECALTNANQAQCAGVSYGDVLGMPIDSLQRVRFRARLSVAPTGVADAWIGLGDTRNDTINSIANRIGFRITGTGNILCEIKDGTTVTSKDSGIALSTTFRTLEIGFTGRDGKKALQFYVEDSNGQVQRVEISTTFNMGAYSGGLQPILQISKTASTDVGTVQVDSMEVDYKE